MFCFFHRLPFNSVETHAIKGLFYCPLNDIYFSFLTLRCFAFGGCIQFFQLDTFRVVIYHPR